MPRLRLGPRASSSGQLMAPDASLASPGDISPSVSPSDAAAHVGVMRLRPAPPQQQPQQQRRWTTGAVAAPRAPAPPPRRASTGSLRDTPSSRWRSRRYRLSTLTMAECMEAAAVALATKAKASSNAADAENADPQHRFVTERRRPNRKPLEAAAREHTAAAAQEAGLTSLVQQELSSTPEPRSKPPLQITLPQPQPACEGAEGEGAAPAAAPEEEEDEVLAAISPQLAQMQISREMQISPQQISPDVITAQMHMHISPLRAADLADSPFAGIAKKMRQQEAGRSREEQEARLSPRAMREGEEEEGAQLASPSSPRAAQLSPPTPEQMRFSPEAAAAPAASDERPGSDAAPQQPSLLKLDLKPEQQQPSDGSRRMLRRMTRSPQIQVPPRRTALPDHCPGPNPGPLHN